MRHRVHARKLSRSPAHRIAMYRNLVTSLFNHERVETTDAKAKELRRIADRMITLGKRGDLHARRRAMRVIRERDVAAKVFGELADRYRTRPGGYTRVLKIRRRAGDSAGMSIVELVEPLEVRESVKGPKTAASRKKGAAKTAAKKKAAEEAGSKKAGAKKTTTKKAAAKKAASKKKKTARKKTAKSKVSKKKSAKSKKSGAKSD